MLDKIMNLVKGQVRETVDNDPEIPHEKKEQTVDAATTSVIDGLKSYLTPDNLGSLTSMLGIGGESDNNAKETMSQGLQSNLVSSLTSKVGLNSKTASRIAIAAIPAIIGLLAKRSNDNKEPDFNLGSIIGAFTGNNSSKKSGGGLGNIIGSFLGKN